MERPGRRQDGCPSVALVHYVECRGGVARRKDTIATILSPAIPLGIHSQPLAEALAGGGLVAS